MRPQKPVFRGGISTSTFIFRTLYQTDANLQPRIMLNLSFFFVIIYLFLVNGQTENGNVMDMIRDRIKQGADYACDVLLNPSGQSKCDYHMLVGKYV